MKAVVLQSAGARPRVTEVQRPPLEPGPSEAVVRVRAAGFSHHDALIMGGVLHRGVRLPLVLGHEVAGTVERVGPGVPPEWIGTAVVVLPGTLGHGTDGGFAELLALPQASLVQLPGGLGFEQAALLAAPVGVAIKAVEEVAGLRPGETVAVTGVSGGLGLHAAQVARAVGARVIGVTSSPAKTQALEAMPWLDSVVTDGGVPWPEVVRALTGEEGAAVVIDTVGGSSVDAAVHALARGGRLVLLGQVSPGPAGLTVAEVVFREARVLGSLGVERRHVERAMELTVSGRLKPVVDRVLPLRAAAVRDAYRLLRERSVIGRVVLVP